MDFSLTEEQQLIVKTTREFVENELYPHEAQVEASGELDASAAQRAAHEGDRRGAVCRQHADGSGRRGSRYGQLDSVRERARPRQLRSALELRSTAVEHPVGV